MRKGIALTTLASLIVVIVGGVLLSSSLTKIAKNSEDPQKELLCKTFNSLADQINPEVGKATIDIAPDACVTINKEIPEKKYDQSTEGAKRNLADLGLKCWDMFLSGKSDRLFGGKIYKSQSKCFICYAVNYKKNKEFESFDNTKLKEYFSQPTTAKDTSDHCNLAGGGKCLDTCTTELPREVRVSKTATKEPCARCCMPDSASKECEAKGGKCLVASSVMYADSYPKWKCPSGQSCYVEKQNMVSYISAIGADGGIFHVDSELNVLPGATAEDNQYAQTYVVAYLDDTKPVMDFLRIGATQNIGNLPAKSIYIGYYKQLAEKCDVQSYA